MNAKEQAVATARARKALALADVLERVDVPAKTAEILDDETWRTAAEAAGVRPPSEDTKSLVVELLRRRENNTGEPFAGLS